MTGPGGAGRLVLVFAVAVLSTFAAHVLLQPQRSSREAAAFAVPGEDLRLALLAADLQELPARLEAWPMYRGVGGDVRRAVAEAPARSGGVVASYRRGWVAWFEGRSGDPWTAESRLPHIEHRIPPSPLPPAGGFRVVVRPLEIVGGAADRLGPGWSALLPREARGDVRAEGGVLLERWTVPCPAPCVLALLDPDGEEGVAAKGWTAVPPEADAVAWYRLDPTALEGSTLERAWPGWAAAERFLDLPLRATLARVLAGPAILSMTEPRADGIPRLLAVVDLRDGPAARAALDRVFALGVLSDAVEVTRYRGVLLGAWHGGSRAPLTPAVAVDGDVLLLALHADELRDAVDRRRAGGAGPWDSRRRLEALGSGSWKTWSRSAVLADAWEEVLSGKPSAGPPVAFQVTGVGRREPEGWVFRSEGGAPLMAAEPVLPAARAVYRALRGQG